MGSFRIFIFGLGIFLDLLTVCLFSHTAGAETCEKWIAKMVSVQGKVQVLRLGERQWQPVKLNDTCCPGDTVRILAQSRADIVLPNETTLRLDQNTTVTFSEPETEKTSLIDLLKGAIHFFSRQRRGIRVVTPFVNATVEGTEFYIEVKEDKTFLSIFEGQVIVTNQAGEIRLARGQSAAVRKDQPPVLQILARPRDAIQWTLYYPPVLDYRPSDFQTSSSTTWQASVQKSIEFYREGNLGNALESLYEGKDEIEDPRFFTYRASLLLSVGRVDEANVDIGKALQLIPMNSSALSLQTIIAVAQNEKEMALSLGRKAIEADPHSASARIALSYALQANFDLQGALSSLKKSVRVEPDNALAWARLSEVLLSFGNLKEALEAAEKATSLNRRLTRTQTVLGFAYLAQIRTKKSKEAFEKAIVLDQGDPLPRMGLGLAKIREGDLKGGREEIEIAASLDPGNSLIRSYLGKAYYEEKRDQLAANQLTMAKELDPSDPTPYFYDAIRKQTINRPVEALQDMHTSIALNDNRAVYRSRLLLDEDLAARSASLGRIYYDLGFQQLALAEGWKSLNFNPGEPSAHRFLSDSYLTIPRYGISRSSELLQALLLQPINITPLQPSRSISTSLTDPVSKNSAILSGTGPSEASYNEFNPLFNRDRLALQASGAGGGNNTWGDEIILSGVLSRYSYSVGQLYYQTDGIRKNNDLNQNLYNAFVQVSLSPKTSVQGEFQSADTKAGDLALRFFPNDFSRTQRQKEETRTMRLGFHHGFSPGSDLIASVMYQSGDSKFRDALTDFGVDYRTEQDSFGGELQYLYSSEYLNVIGGAGYFHVNSDTHLTVFIPSIPQLFASTDEGIIRHTNVYLYSQINYLKHVTFTVGASADFLGGGLEGRNQLNPKLGITWNPFTATTIRAALFRTLNRTLINSQTIEPTQIAGFNQFFNDFSGTDAWQYGIAVDQKFSKNIYGGAGFSIRDLEFPYTEVAGTGPVVRKTKWRESVGRAYAYWTPHKWFGLSAEYLYERFTRDEEIALGVKEVETHRVPLGINFYHPSGLGAILKGTYVNQRGSFERQYPGVPGVFIQGDDQFCVFDAAISYRLPKRFGYMSIEGKNLFNRSFRFQDTDPVNPQVQPKRLIYGKFTLVF